MRQCLRSYILEKLLPKTSIGGCNSSVQPTHNGHTIPPDASRIIQHNLGLETDPSREERQESYNFNNAFEDEPSTRSTPRRQKVATVRSYSFPHTDAPTPKPSSLHHTTHSRDPSATLACEPKRIFKPLEEYIIKAFTSFDSINSSFTSHTCPELLQRKPEPSRRPANSKPATNIPRDEAPSEDDFIPDIDPKMLLLGDVAENGSWWTGGRPHTLPARQTPRGQPESHSSMTTTMKTPNINWDDLDSWYSLIINAAQDWLTVYEEVCTESNTNTQAQKSLQVLEQELLQGQLHTQRVLLKATESLLKRPGRPIKDPYDLRFLLLLLQNPLLQSDVKPFYGIMQPEQVQDTVSRPIPFNANKLPTSGLLSGQHSGIIKRIIGLISNASAENHNRLITWFANFGDWRFGRTKDLISGFLSYRLLRQIDKKHPTEIDITAGLIPEMRSGRSTAGSYLHDEIRSVGPSRKEPEQKIAYTEDWQTRAASRVLALLFAANNSPGVKYGHSTVSGVSIAAVGSTRAYGHSGGQILPISHFYNSIIDFADLVSDFESWESKRTTFSFCQYPFLMSIWAKTKILEHDTRRQMQMKARDAFLDSIMTNKNVKQYLSLNVRRDCLVEDSLAAVSEVIGSGSEDVKKALRITFRGEEGIDGGGLRKEWFLLLVREVFNPDHGKCDSLMHGQATRLANSSLLQAYFYTMKIPSTAISTHQHSKHQTSSS